MFDWLRAQLRQRPNLFRRDEQTPDVAARKRKNPWLDDEQDRIALDRTEEQARLGQTKNRFSIGRADESSEESWLAMTECATTAPLGDCDSSTACSRLPSAIAGRVLQDAPYKEIYAAGQNEENPLRERVLTLEAHQRSKRHRGSLGYSAPIPTMDMGRRQSYALQHFGSPRTPALGHRSHLVSSTPAASLWSSSTEPRHAMGTPEDIRSVAGGLGRVYGARKRSPMGGYEGGSLRTTDYRSPVQSRAVPDLGGHTPRTLIRGVIETMRHRPVPPHARSAHGGVFAQVEENGASWSRAGRQAPGLRPSPAARSPRRPWAVSSSPLSSVWQDGSPVRESEGQVLQSAISANVAKSIRGLGDLRSKARNVLEKDASKLIKRNPEGAERLFRDARNIENWGTEAAEGARRAAAEEAQKRHEVFVAQEAVRQERAREAARKRAAEAEEELRREANQARTQVSPTVAEKERGMSVPGEPVTAIFKCANSYTPKTRPYSILFPKSRRGWAEFTIEQEEKIGDARDIPPSSDAQAERVMVKAFNDTVIKRSMCTLRNGVWLGDEVLNLYFKILQQRNREAVADGKLVPRCGIMSSFFYTQLSDNGRGYRYAGVKRFLKKAKLNLFDLDKFMFPVNVDKNHWTLAVINFRQERVEYYDSLGGAFDDDDRGFEFAVKFVNDESMAKRGGEPMDISAWPKVRWNAPRQENFSDCGVFCSMFADRVSKGKPVNFSQENMERCRKLMTLAVLRGESVPSDQEALLEDWGCVPAGYAWWNEEVDGEVLPGPKNDDMQNGYAAPESQRRDEKQVLQGDSQVANQDQSFWHGGGVPVSSKRRTFGVGSDEHSVVGSGRTKRDQIENVDAVMWLQSASGHMGRNDGDKNIGLSTSTFDASWT